MREREHIDNYNSHYMRNLEIVDKLNIQASKTGFCQIDCKKHQRGFIIALSHNHAPYRNCELPIIRGVNNRVLGYAGTTNT